MFSFAHAAVKRAPRSVRNIVYPLEAWRHAHVTSCYVTKLSPQNIHPPQSVFTSGEVGGGRKTWDKRLGALPLPCPQVAGSLRRWEWLLVLFVMWWEAAGVSCQTASGADLMQHAVPANVLGKTTPELRPLADRSWRLTQHGGDRTLPRLSFFLGAYFCGGGILILLLTKKRKST